MCPQSTPSPHLGTDIGTGASGQEALPLPITEELPSVPPVPPPLRFPTTNHCSFTPLEAFFLSSVVPNTPHSPCPAQWHQLGAAAPLVLCTVGNPDCDSSPRPSALSPEPVSKSSAFSVNLQCSTSRLKTRPTVTLPHSEPSFGNPKSSLGSHCLSHSYLSSGAALSEMRDAFNKAHPNEATNTSPSTRLSLLFPDVHSCASPACFGNPTWNCTPEQL